MTNDALASGLISLSYRDYIAARFLINNKYYMQGLYLASSAIEKQMKAVLGLNGLTTKYHLDNIGQIKKKFKETEYSMLFDRLDPNFLDVLSQAYKYRYYDTAVTKPDTVGIFVNQFLGELDWTYAYIDQLFKFTDNEGASLETQYKRNAKEKHPDLLLNNMVLNNIPKKEFMERVSDAFGLHISPAFHGTEFELFGTNVKPITYDGKIMQIVMKNESKKD